MTPDQPQPTPRSRKMYVLWAIALTLLLSTALFCWLVVVPVWEVRAHVRNPGASELSTIELLGGEKRAAERLAAFARMPDWIASRQDKDCSIMLLSNCGESGVRACGELLSIEDKALRRRAMFIILAQAPVRDVSAAKADVLRALQEVPDEKIKRWASEVLTRLANKDDQLLDELKVLARQGDKNTKLWARVAYESAEEWRAKEAAE